MDYIIEEIGREFYLISSPEAELNRNIYLKRFISSDRKEKVNMLLDPGTPLDFEFLAKALKELIGGISKVDLVFISHQDPDVSSNLKAILAGSPNATILSSIDTFRLVSMYGLPQKNLKAIESFKKDILKISKTGHLIQFIPAYYCHFRGSYMFYDFESRVLFSGDFLGGTKTKSGDGIYADESSWTGISIFHQIYMPTKKALLLTIDRIGYLNPLPEVIAPQHGNIIKGDLIFNFITKLTNLDVGIDLLSWTKSETDNLIIALNQFLLSLKEVDIKVYEDLLEKMKKRGEFTTIFNFSQDVIKEVKLLPKDAVDFIVRILHETDNPNEYISLLFNTLINNGLYDKLPNLQISQEAPKDVLTE